MESTPGNHFLPHQNHPQSHPQIQSQSLSQPVSVSRFTGTDSVNYHSIANSQPLQLPHPSQQQHHHHDLSNVLSNAALFHQSQNNVAGQQHLHPLSAPFPLELPLPPQSLGGLGSQQQQQQPDLAALISSNLSAIPNIQDPTGMQGLAAENQTYLTPQLLTTLFQDCTTVTEASLKWATQEFIKIQHPRLYPEYPEFVSSKSPDKPSTAFFQFLYNLLINRVESTGIMVTLTPEDLRARWKEFHSPLFDRVGWERDFSTFKEIFLPFSHWSPQLPKFQNAETEETLYSQTTLFDYLKWVYQFQSFMQDDDENGAGNGVWEDEAGSDDDLEDDSDDSDYVPNETRQASPASTKKSKKRRRVGGGRLADSQDIDIFDLGSSSDEDDDNIGHIDFAQWSKVFEEDDDDTDDEYQFPDNADENADDDDDEEEEEEEEEGVEDEHLLGNQINDEEMNMEELDIASGLTRPRQLRRKNGNRNQDGEEQPGNDDMEPMHFQPDDGDNDFTSLTDLHASTLEAVTTDAPETTQTTLRQRDQLMALVASRGENASEQPAQPLSKAELKAQRHRLKRKMRYIFENLTPMEKLQRMLKRDKSRIKKLRNRAKTYHHRLRKTRYQLLVVKRLYQERVADVNHGKELNLVREYRAGRVSKADIYCVFLECIKNWIKDKGTTYNLAYRLRVCEMLSNLSIPRKLYHEHMCRMWQLWLGFLNFGDVPDFAIPARGSIWGSQGWIAKLEDVDSKTVYSEQLASVKSDLTQPKVITLDLDNIDADTDADMENNGGNSSNAKDENTRLEIARPLIPYRRERLLHTLSLNICSSWKSGEEKKRKTVDKVEGTSQDQSQQSVIHVDEGQGDSIQEINDTNADVEMSSQSQSRSISSSSNTFVSNVMHDDAPPMRFGQSIVSPLLKPSVRVKATESSSNVSSATAPASASASASSATTSSTKSGKTSLATSILAQIQARVDAAMKESTSNLELDRPLPVSKGGRPPKAGTKNKPKPKKSANKNSSSGREQQKQTEPGDLLDRASTFLESTEWVQMNRNGANSDEDEDDDDNLVL